MKSRNFLCFFKTLVVILCMFVASSVFAVGPPGDASDGIALKEITANVGSTVYNLVAILLDVSLVAGIAFILASFFKFHQHKLNPTQVPISQGVTLLLIGAALTCFTVMLPTTKKAIFGDSGQMTKLDGSALSGLIGSDPGQK